MFAVVRFFLALVVALILARFAFELAAPMVADAAKALSITAAEAWRLLVLGAVLFVLVDWRPRRGYGRSYRRR